MTVATTSLAPANSTRGEWARFGAFLIRPVLPDRAEPFRLSHAVPVMRLLLLDLLVMGLLLSIAGLAMLSGIDIPETALAGMEMGAMLVVFAVLVAPITEEAMFRGWVSGRPGHVLAVLILGAAALVMTSDLTRSEAEVNWKAIAVAGTALVGAILAVILLRNRGAMGWFQRLFPLFFWISCALFAAIHLLNFAEAEWWTILPLVLPQFSVGMMLGYLRVNYGLWSSMLLHILHNGAFISLVLLATGAK
ncbi:CPBP family glutamic-type intramembrane protease [Qipengyuania qiaonensis]|uniref:CPBP family intramembrane metalloprotease n=1 Tax=Qipengyuania qiaonensis TaxID=2867240 RepID=A0ABS7J2M1_9SPHN|nr:CPBP family glutamic-type intramembrane protease [Qipengyuania qiaonensis]MBX7481569.1 CPBP family intramembrane metalloprotease [Qipengyuania qiaonensis]